MIRSLAVGIVTVERPVNYIHRTIESIEKTGLLRDASCLPVRLCVGGFESLYLDRYRVRPGQFEVVECDTAMGSTVGQDGMTTARRIACNHYRTLRELVDRSTEEHIVVFEDDIVLSVGWIERLHRTIDSLTQAFADRWALTLYPTSGIPSLAAYENQRLWTDVPPLAFFGFQGMVYPRGVAAEFADYLLENCVNTFVMEADLLLGRYSIERGVPLLGSAPALVQHVGRVTTGGSVEFHDTENFVASVQ